MPCFESNIKVQGYVEIGPYNQSAYAGRWFMYTKTHSDNIHADLVIHSINGATVVFNDVFDNPFGGSNVTTTSNNDVFVTGDFYTL